MTMDHEMMDHEKLELMRQRAEKAEARIAKLEAERDVWKLRCAGALSILPDDLRIGELRDATIAIEAERDRLAADCAVMREALEYMGALHFRYDLSQKEREERCGEISRRVSGSSEALSAHPGDKLLAVVEATRKAAPYLQCVNSRRCITPEGDQCAVCELLEALATLDSGEDG